MFTFIVILGDNAVDTAKLTHVTFSLRQSARYFNNTYHDMSDREDKGYISFYDWKNSRYILFKSCLFC